jgi:hypothetical protein
MIQDNYVKVAVVLAIFAALLIGIAVGHTATRNQAVADIDAARARSAAEVSQAKAAEDAAADAEAEADRQAALAAASTLDDQNVRPGSYIVGEELPAGNYSTINPIDSHCLMVQHNHGKFVDNDYAIAGHLTFTVTDIPGSTFSVRDGCGPVERIS